MAKNGYLERRDAREQAILDAGESMGMQKMWDYIQLALRNPKTMGKDIFGRKRLEALYHDVSELASYYHTAFTDDVEADHRQEELDARLEEVWEEDLSPFYERYPQFKKQKYNKPKKGWV